MNMSYKYSRLFMYGWALRLYINISLQTWMNEHFHFQLQLCFFFLLLRLDVFSLLFFSNIFFILYHMNENETTRLRTRVKSFIKIYMSNKFHVLWNKLHPVNLYKNLFISLRLKFSYGMTTYLSEFFFIWIFI